MEITVKILQGEECQVEVSQDTTISMLKTLVESKLRVPKQTQKLVYRGKTLQDDETVTSSRLTPGAKVFLVTMKTTASAPPTDPWAPLQSLAERHLGKEDAPRLLAEFKKKFELRLSAMSMDDIQRFCASDMKEF
ncbi:ubiquitin-like protein 4A [Pollicipes pollicipes]|uniref:ubiquitin-like protein 4A n=1 Tax=Pollicipes pollicipes TaxID=41117 RepID=UPI0018850C6A|nr:ubiquitin-like protein 4A [Pollicipes pollicipes]XP_037080942.1 ubiquitin-like protein 4A [Pollicipes pollicipes]